MEKLLTVVIPAYNAEKYIEYTLDSLCAGCFGESRKNSEDEESIWTKKKENSEIQTMMRAEKPELWTGRNWSDYLEILVVDDGSKDHTGEIADRYAGQYPEVVRVIHKENGGHGSGINCGIQNASGRYMKVVDADDWVDPEAFAHLMEALKNCQDDVVVSGFYWRFDNGSGEESSFPKKAEILEPFPGVKYGISYKFDGIADQIYMKMHGITWKTEILRKMPLSIDEHCYYVDAEYILYPIPWVKTVSFIPDFVYQYRIGREGQSVSPEKMIKNKENYDRVMESLLSFYRLYQDGKLIGKDETKISCSQEKLQYLENGIARVAAGRVKILLSLPADKKVKHTLIQFEGELLRNYPEIYHANRNKAVKLLRVSRYGLYRAAVWTLSKMNRSF